MANFTDAQRANLEKLAAYLESLPAGYRHFAMQSYINKPSDPAVIHYALNNGGVESCGSVACAVGHGPAAGILVDPDYIEEFGGRKEIGWDEYAAEKFTDDDRATWWMFAGVWSAVDNHHHGAAARIRYVLANGEPPSDYDFHPEEHHVALYAPYRIDTKERAVQP